MNRSILANLWMPWLVMLLGGGALAAAVALRIAARSVGGAGGTVSPRILLIETAVFILILLFATWPASVRRILGELDRLRLLLIVAFVGAILTFQLAAMTRLKPFPFTHWTMYTKRAEAQSFGEFIVVLESGRIEPYPFHRIQRTSPRSFMNRFAHWLFLATDPSVEEARRDAARAELTAAMHTLAAIHDRLRPDDPVVSIEAIRCTIVTAEYTGPESISRTTAVRVEFDRK